MTREPADDRAAEALDGSTPEPVGRFSYDVRAETWWWSDEVFELFGFAPGEVVPTTDLWLAHKHSDHANEAGEALKRTFSSGQAFSSFHRVADSRSKLHDVLVVGEGVLDDRERLLEVRGYVVDVTESRRLAVERTVRDAVAGVTESRSVIDEAKGALMGTFGITAEEAFALLSEQSQNSNVKLRVVARTIVVALTDVDTTLPDDLRRRVERVLARQR